MKEEVRRAIAWAAASRINGPTSGLIFSYAKGQNTPMSGGLSNAFDHELGAQITGSDAGLYHHGLNCHISLKFDGSTFSGVEHGEGHKFTGSVHDREIRILDHGDSQDYSYKV